MRTKDQVRLKCPWVPEVFHSNFNSKARRVAILIGKTIQFSASNVIRQKWQILNCYRYTIPCSHFINIYAPNFNDPHFMNKLLECLPSLNNNLLIVGGDMNCVIDPNLDRSNPRNLTPSLMSRSHSDFMSKNACIDPWRFYNPHTTTFFSQMHQSFSRIDYYFIDSKLILKVLTVNYHPIVISDHAPLSLDIQFSSQPRYPTPWRFNTLLLSDDTFYKFIAAKIDGYIAINKNDTDPVSCSLLWESLKAYIRGQIILYSAHLNLKSRKAKLQELSIIITKLDQQLTCPSPSLLKQRIELQTEASSSSATSPGSLMIPWIKDSSGTLHSDPTTINSVFYSFYSSLYKSESPPDTTEMNSFLDFSRS